MVSIVFYKSVIYTQNMFCLHFMFYIFPVFHTFTPNTYAT